MSNINERQAITPRIGLLDLLDEKSLETMKKLGHIYTDRFTGRKRIRVFNKK